MATGKRGQRAALTSAPARAPAPKPTPAAAPTSDPVSFTPVSTGEKVAVTLPPPAPRRCLVVELAAAERTALTRGDHVAHAALSELHVAAGLLQAKASTRLRELSGPDADLARKVLDLL